MSVAATVWWDRRFQWRRRVALTLIGIALGARPGLVLACAGDCDGDGTVTVNELVTAVTIALGTAALSTCTAVDANGDGTVIIDELVAAVSSALIECAGGPTTTLTGSCEAPGGHGNRGLQPCAAGTPITVYRCDDRSQCLHQHDLTMIASGAVADNGGWAVQIGPTNADAALVFQASITDAVVYRALGFGGVGSSQRAGLAHATIFAPVAITPVTEAGVELLDMNGFENYSNTGAQQVLGAVEQATANVSFDGDMPDTAVSAALQIASADPTVMTLLQTARTSPTPTPTVSAGRFVDNGDGTITDPQTGLIWEKKDLGGGLHDESIAYVWAGSCSDNSGYCQPDAAAASTCTTATGGAIGCAQCGGAASCETSGGLLTIWQWLNQLNAANFVGHSDWRIPTIEKDGGRAELETIADTNAPECIAANQCVPMAFNSSCTAGCAVTTCSCTQYSLYWSATTDANSPIAAWLVNFNFGSVYDSGKSLGLYVRAVRGGS